MHPKFITMDGLSMRKIPFFFMVDFLKNNVEVFTECELEQSGLQFDFQLFTKNGNARANKPEVKLEINPENIATYQKGFEIIQEKIKRGDSYLANYTRKTPIETNLSLQEIFDYSRTKYKILYRENFVCFSPETFIEIKENRITTHPMKGTIDADLPDAEQLLRNNPKEKAEHYTVVDLLRNDLSKVADNVKVDDFQRIDFVETHSKNLLQMSSKVSGALKPLFQDRIGSIMDAILPAGSILGAPKDKTLEMILMAEGFDRQWYTGVAGWYDGESLDTCVMIRFIEEENGRKFFKSGGGITHQSVLEEEYKEMISKIYVPIY